MDCDVETVFLYIAMFGFSDLLVSYFNINSAKSKLIYYTIILAISLFFYSTNILSTQDLYERY